MCPVFQYMTSRRMCHAEMPDMNGVSLDVA